MPVARRAGCSSAETEAISITAATEIRETFIMTMMNRLIVGYYYLSIDLQLSQFKKYGHLFPAYGDCGWAVKVGVLSLTQKILSRI